MPSSWCYSHFCAIWTLISLPESSGEQMHAQMWWRKDRAKRKNLPPHCVASFAVASRFLSYMDVAPISVSWPFLQLRWWLSQLPGSSHGSFSFFACLYWYAFAFIVTGKPFMHASISKEMSWKYAVNMVIPALNLPIYTHLYFLPSNAVLFRLLWMTRYTHAVSSALSDEKTECILMQTDACMSLSSSCFVNRSSTFTAIPHLPFRMAETIYWLSFRLHFKWSYKMEKRRVKHSRGILLVLFVCLPRKIIWVLFPATVWNAKIDY